MTLTFRIPNIPDEIRPLADELIDSKEFQRLRNISFLGAIERFGKAENTRRYISAGSRYEHSLGVAALILHLRDHLNMSPGEFRIAFVHALLHDIGHGPFSHSSEDFFQHKYGIDHHTVLQKLIENAQSPISVILRHYSLWIDYRRFVKRPACVPIVSAIFYGPINVDTIEGILRAASFFGIDPELDMESIVDSVSKASIALKPLDRFWNLKSKVYNEYIFGSKQSKCDNLLSDVLLSVEDEVEVTDFFLDDGQFECRFGSAIQRQLNRTGVPGSKIQRKRFFEIDRTASPKKLEKLNARYSEKRGINADRGKRY